MVEWRKKPIQYRSETTASLRSPARLPVPRAGAQGKRTEKQVRPRSPRPIEMSLVAFYIYCYILQWWSLELETDWLALDALPPKHMTSQWTVSLCYSSCSLVGKLRRPTTYLHIETSLPDAVGLGEADEAGPLLIVLPHHAWWP